MSSCSVSFTCSFSFVEHVLKGLHFRIEMFTHLKLYFAARNHNFKLHCCAKPKHNCFLASQRRNTVVQYAVPALVATDTSGASAYLNITINLNDVNNFSPEFAEDYTLAVSEDTPVGTVLLEVTATDRDLGDKGLARYGIDQDQPMAEYLGVRTERRGDQLVGVVYVKEQVCKAWKPSYIFFQIDNNHFCVIVILQNLTDLKFT